MSNNKIILEGCISQYKKENQLDLSESDLFELFVLSQITKNLNITFENIIDSVVDGSADGGVDSIIITVDNEVVESLEEISEFVFTNVTKTNFIITQSKKEGTFKEGTIDKLITTSEIIFDLEKIGSDLDDRFNNRLVAKILILRDVWLKTSINGGSIKTDFNYCCIAPSIIISPSFKSKMSQLKHLTLSKCSNSEVHFECFSSEELLKFYQTRKQSRFSLHFKDHPLSTSFSETGIGYVGTMKLGAYKQFLTDANGNIKDYLFESNIRHFQGASVDVNKKIAKTIAENTFNDFWWLNNGITIIAENPNQAAKILSVDNVQIVNGLQTSYSIFNSHDGSLVDERSVLVKVIINKDNETIDSIIESTNSQNAVSSTALRATEVTQRKLELFFLNEGYFYDRRKNYYKNLAKPSAKIFSIQFAAQAIETILFGSPHTARSKPTSIIKDDVTYNKIFDPNKNFKAYLNCCLLLKMTNDYWSNIDSNDKKDTTANFKLHLARVATSTILDKAEYSFEDILGLDINLYTKGIFDSSTTILISSIRDFLEDNPSVNLINMAKSKPYTDKMFQTLHSNQDLLF